MPQSKLSIIRTKRTGLSSSGLKTSPAVSYGTLSKALEDLGYRRMPAPGSHVIFKHSGTNARLFLPWRRETTSVDAARLNGVYQLVEEAGIASRQQIEAVLATVGAIGQKRVYAGPAKPPANQVVVTSKSGHNWPKKFSRLSAKVSKKNAR